METLNSPAIDEQNIVEVPLTSIDFQNDQKRRSSSRSIKRKRFDDEIVEYSIGLTQSREQNRLGRTPDRPRVISLFQPSPQASQAQAPTTFKEVAAATASVNTATATAVASSSVSQPPAQTLTLNLPIATAVERPTVVHMPDKRRPGRSNNRKSRKSGRVSNQVTTKDLGRWKPVDDLSLIIGIQQTNDLRMVHRGTKFSCKFTLQELQARWFSLLYEPAISRIAVAAMRNLHPELVESVQRKALYSTQEEELLGTIKSTDNPKVEQFQELLNNNASVFYSARTAKSLQNHWQMMKQYQLLPDQIIVSVGEQPMTFSDAEDLILDADLNEPRDEALEIELSLADRQNKREIRLLENELSRWNVLVDSITGAGIAPEFDSQTLAVLRGRLVRYLMRSKEITFGREAKDSTVDVDLSLEGPSCRISRRQGTIKLRSNGDFFIANEGKRPIFIDGVPLLTGNKLRLSNNCVVEICGLRFVFLVNYELINAIRHESAKTTSPLN